jgi:hypothetical protein
MIFDPFWAVLNLAGIFFLFGYCLYVLGISAIILYTAIQAILEKHRKS